MNTIRVDTAKLLRMHGSVQGRVPYVFGAKARPLCGGPEALAGLAPKHKQQIAAIVNRFERAILDWQL